MIADDDIKISLIATPRIFPKINFASKYGQTFAFVNFLPQAYYEYSPYFLFSTFGTICHASKFELKKVDSLLWSPNGPLLHTSAIKLNRTKTNNNKTSNCICFSFAPELDCVIVCVAMIRIHSHTRQPLTSTNSHNPHAWALLCDDFCE